MSITQSSTRLVALVAGVSVALSLFVGAFAAAPAQAAALTQSQISAIISLLQSFGADAATVANVTASLNGQATPGTGGTSGGSSAACPALSRSLQQGSTGADVMALQKFLNGSAATQVAVSGAGSPGLESTFFGPATDAAVKKFQTLNGVSSIGIVGPATRAAIAAVCGGSTGGGTTPSGPGITVSASAQPANSLAPAGATRVPFTTFTLTNNSGVAQTVTGVTVQRVGLGVDANFSGIVLVDSSAGMQIGTSRTLDSNHQATIGDTFTLQAGQSKTLTVAGNIAAVGTAQSGQIVSLQVTNVASSAAITGSLPIMGASHTINTTLTLGSATAIVSSLDPQTAQTKNLGDMGIKFSGVRITAGSAEDLRLYSIRWRLNGSVGSGDLANVMTYVDGVAYPTVVSADGRYYSASFAGGVLISKGISKDIYVQGDIVGSNASGRTVEIDIDRSSDIYLVGQLYGYGVTPTGPSGATSPSSSASHVSAITTGQPWFQGAIVTVTGASVTSIGRATEVPAQNISVNVPGQPLGGFVADMRGEAITVSTMVFDIASTSGSAGSGTGLITNITLVNENGAVIAGPVDATILSSGTQRVSFNNSITLATGRHVYTLKGTIPVGATTNTAYVATTDPSSSTYWSGITGQTTGNSITLTNSSFSLNTMTVRGAALNITASSQPANQTIVAGGQQVLIGNIQLDASQSGEDIRVNSLPIRINSNAGSGSTGVGALSSCQIYNGSTSLTTGSNTKASVIDDGTPPNYNAFTFDNSLVIPKGTVVTVSVKCNVGSNAAADYYTAGIDTGDTFAATGVQSGSSLTDNSNLTETTGTSGQQLVATSALAVSNDSSSPSYTLVAGGTTGQTIGAFKFTSTGEDMTITKIGVTGSPSTVYNDVTAVTIWDGATQVGSAIFTGTGTVATSTLSTPVTVTKNVDKVLTFKVSTASVGIGQSGTAGDLVAVTVNSVEASGVQSGTTVRVGASTTVAGARLLRSYPTVAMGTLSSSGVGDGKLIRFSVTANAAGSIGLEQFGFSFATSTSATVTALNLYAFTDSGYSNPVSGASNGLVNASPINPTGAAGSQTARIVANNATNGAIQVAAGSTVYFELRATVTGVTTGSSVSTTLLGDSAYGTLATGTSTQNGSYYFVWSPNSTTTAGNQSTDWTSGNGVPGLSVSGFTMTRSN